MVSGKIGFAERESSCKLVSVFGEKAQGTIEYLVIIGIVIVLSLVVVGFVLTQSDSIEQSSAGGNKLGMSVQSIGVTESLVDTDGNFVVRLLNNSGDVVTISDVSVGGTSVDFSQDLAQGGDKFFRVNTGETCEEGKIVSKDLIVTYVTKYGLTKTQRFNDKVMFNCDNFNINASLLANQCLTADYYFSEDKSYFVRNTVGSDGNYTVSDPKNNLMWQDGGISYEIIGDLGTYCDDLDWADYDDWRLPNVYELYTLIDIAYSEDNYFPSAFENGLTNDMWSSTTIPSPNGYMFALVSATGDIYDVYSSTGYSRGVRCVRSA